MKIPEDEAKILTGMIAAAVNDDDWNRVNKILVQAIKQALLEGAYWAADRTLDDDDYERAWLNNIIELEFGDK